MSVSYKRGSDMTVEKEKTGGRWGTRVQCNEPLDGSRGEPLVLLMSVIWYNVRSVTASGIVFVRVGYLRVIKNWSVCDSCSVLCTV